MPLTKQRRHGLWLAIRRKHFVDGEWRKVHSEKQSWDNIIVTVVARYMRLHGMDRVGEYNDLCEYLSNELSGNPRVTFKSISIDKHDCRKRHRRVQFQFNSRFVHVEPPRCFDSQIVWKRYQRLLAAQEHRVAYQCQHCETMHNVAWRPTPRLPRIYSFTELDKGNTGRTRLCLSCWNRWRGIHNQATQVAEIKSLINEAKRKMKDGCTI